MTDVQMDLADFQALSKYNKGYKYCLLGVDVMSRRFFACPVLSKKSSDMLKAFECMFRKMPQIPQVIFTDKGKEFVAKDVKNFLDSKNLELRHGENAEIKAAVAERGIRTLKSRLYKYFSAQNTLNWIGVLDKFINAINNTVCRSTGLKPKDINSSNWFEIWKKIYQSDSPKAKEPKFKVGDWVRISRQAGDFDKGYWTTFTDEIFKITKINRTNPITFELVDSEGEPIEGRFYTEELSLTSEDTEYRIEKILKTRLRKGIKEGFVKWIGFPSSKNSWVQL
ncbi:unnamed protein product [Bursaphelenchus xylophilus]|uniref:(pine wood nematode) hypothetical protein n=1 Tax=Bursaphelenchus xylophilus TaxID=6326 RepID=A0A1I7SFX9_BURXY|nr:unnamed protein product [Bursaphelenchus xylophilus]CAD5210827.1 unnamed protein product [Bursaphelenchus xylophilus]CAD5230990.1 unnamed protein product [Bursaphelenchus xylophilus]CAG9078991.1 unnamed protein product [Bursaphelenchus xylophilus]CAG9087095.1 unnamed protein product [Bursaphelenchus xylophilus]